MGRIDSALKFYVAQRHGSPLILVHSVSGIPEIAELSYPLLRVSYLSSADGTSAEALNHARTELGGSPHLLFLTTPSPDGPPYRSGVVFNYRGKSNVNWTDGRNGKAAIEADEYLAAVAPSLYPWGADIQGGRTGYFLSGTSVSSSLWRVARVETDLAGRQLFTLSPLQLASGLPEVDFSSVGDAPLRQKLKSDWGELQRCLEFSLYSSLITAAKDVAESLVVYAVSSQPGKLTIDQGLRKVGKALEQKQKLRLAFTFLDYHLMSKLRILHGNKHSDRVVISERLVDPGFALTVVPDIVEVLKSVGLLRLK